MNHNLFETLRAKALLKQQVFDMAFQAFNKFKKALNDYSTQYQLEYKENKDKVEFDLNDNDDYRLDLTFGGDVLIFMLHTNIFEFPRMHEVMKTKYIEDDKQRSYCGVINIYNFLADSFRFNRPNDLGYMIGRVFINKENHYFIEGKRELGQLYNNFATSELNNDAVRGIIESAIKYTINFDLLTPPYEEVKLVRMGDMQATSDIKLVTGKRLGFRFQADHEEIKEVKLNKFTSKD